MLTGGESIEQLVFYKKLHVKDVKINEVSKTKEEKGVGQGHPASKSLIKKSILFGPQLRWVYRNQFS